MVIELLFKILEWIYPVYYEVNVRYNGDTTTKTYHYTNKGAAEEYYKFLADLGKYRGVSAVYFDKYINVQGHFLIKCGKQHKGVML